MLADQRMFKPKHHMTVCDVGHRFWGSMGQVLYYLVAETKNVDIKDILLNRRFREHLEVHQLQKFFFLYHFHARLKGLFSSIILLAKKCDVLLYQIGKK